MARGKRRALVGTLPNASPGGSQECQHFRRQNKRPRRRKDTKEKNLNPPDPGFFFVRLRVFVPSRSWWISVNMLSAIENTRQMCAVSGSCTGWPASSDASSVSTITGARRKTSSSDCVGERVEYRAAAGGDRRLADAARADRRFRIGNVQRGPRHRSAARRESSAACSGRSAWRAARRSAGRRPSFWPIA